MKRISVNIPDDMYWAIQRLRGTRLMNNKDTTFTEMVLIVLREGLK